MGYITTPVSELILPIFTRSNITLTTTPTDIDLHFVVMPPGVKHKNIVYAHIEFCMCGVRNSFAGANSIAPGSSFQISDDGGTTWHDALSPTNLLTFTAVTARLNGLVTFSGDADISAYVIACSNAAVNVYFRWVQASSAQNNLEIDDYTVFLHLFLA